MRCMPPELVRLIIQYVFIRPPFAAPLPPRMLNRAPPPENQNPNLILDRDRDRDFGRDRDRKQHNGEEDDGRFVGGLVGSCVYLVHERGDATQERVCGPIARSPFIVVWAAVVSNNTYFGVIFPSVEFNANNLSLAFGKPQDLKSLDMPRCDCSLVFYDLDITQRRPDHIASTPQPDVDFSICRINALNLAKAHRRLIKNGSPSDPSLTQTYPVLILRIPAKITDADPNPHFLAQTKPPFYDRVFPVDLFAPAQHPLWPWNNEPTKPTH